jgi:hypothetical protein
MWPLGSTGVCTKLPSTLSQMARFTFYTGNSEVNTDFTSDCSLYNFTGIFSLEI